MENKRVRGSTSGRCLPAIKIVEYPPPPPPPPPNPLGEEVSLRNRYVSFASKYDKISLKAGFRKLTYQAKNVGFLVVLAAEKFGSHPMWRANP